MVETWMWIAGGVGGILLIYIISVFNRLILLNTRVNNAWAQIDVQLKRRLDLIPNLLETVKGYMRYEKKVLTEVTEARTALMRAKTPAQAAKADGLLTGALKTLFAVAENYPKLEASQNFMSLQEELTGTEDRIAFARQFYNDSVMEYVTYRKYFPQNIFAGILGFPPEREFFQAEEGARAPVKVSFE